MYNIKWKSHKISDFLADYEPYEKNEPPATAVISNHKSFFDFFLLLSFKESPCFVAKTAFIRYPLIGQICTNLQSIYVSKASVESRQKALTDIKQRMVDISSGKKFPPLMMFPEGNTTNGDDCMNHQKGAYVEEEPIKIYGFQYGQDSFNPTINTGTILDTVI